MEITALYQIIQDSKGFTTDSRELKDGQIFFALNGEKFDGHSFVDEAIAIGADKVIIDNPAFERAGKTILVEDVLATFQALSRFHRRQFDIPVIGITGSNGKTTTKELINAVLSKKFKTLATIGNLNNHIGVPKTLFQLNNKHEIAIVEMGANHQNEIELLSSLAEPTHGIITSIGTAHLEGFSGPEGVKKAKAELYDWLSKSNGIVFLNTDLAVLNEMAIKSAVTNRINYGSDITNQYVFKLIDASPFVRFEHEKTIVQTQLPGEYNYNNFITAYTIGLHFGVDESDIIAALESYVADNKRSQIINWESNTVIMDAYNANPTSMSVALDNLSSMEASSKWAVLGDMLELGNYSTEEHQSIAEKAESLHLEGLCLVGEEFSKCSTKNPNTVKVKHVEQAAEWLKNAAPKKALLLLKGSNSIKVDKAIQTN